jgi:hypothetical protein
MMVSEMEEGPAGLPRVVALCAVDTLSRTYSFSEIITKLQVEMSTSLLGGAPPQIGRAGSKSRGPAVVASQDLRVSFFIFDAGALTL